MHARKFFKPKPNSVSQLNSLQNAVQKRITPIIQTFPSQSQLETARKSAVEPFEGHIITPLLLQEWVHEIGDGPLQEYLNRIQTNLTKPVSYETLYEFLQILLCAVTKPAEFIHHPVIIKLCGQSCLAETMIILYIYQLLNPDNFKILYTMSTYDRVELCKLLGGYDSHMLIHFHHNQIIRKILPYSLPYLHDLTIMLDFHTKLSTRQDLQDILALTPIQMKQLHEKMVAFLRTNPEPDSAMPMRLSCLKIAGKLNEGLARVLNAGVFDMHGAMTLVRAGASPHMTDDDGNTILHKMIEKLVQSFNPRLCMDIIRELVQDWHANLTLRNNRHILPWERFLAAKNPKHIQYARELLNLGVNFAEMAYLDVDATPNSSYINMLIDNRKRNPAAKKLLKILQHNYESTLKNDWHIDPAGYIDCKTIIKGKQIGQGSYGTVYPGQWKDNLIAMKYMPLHQFHTFANEMYWLQHLRAPHIIHLHGYCMDIYTNSLYIFMEFAVRGSLETLYSTENIWKLSLRLTLIQQLVKGLLWIHQNQSVHGDLKSGNVVVDKYDILKIIDFGCSAEAGKHHRRVGSHPYMAPELLDPQHKQTNTYATDIYSLGHTLCEIISWESIDAIMQLDDDYTNEQLAVDVINGFRPIIPTAECPAKLDILINQTWKKDPVERPSIEQLHEEVQRGFGII